MTVCCGRYTASASKEGYHFRAQGARGLDFVHQRLADVTVRVTDAGGAGVAGALLSLSGSSECVARSRAAATRAVHGLMEVCVCVCVCVFGGGKAAGWVWERVSVYALT